MIKKVRSVKNTVLKILRDYPAARDNDRLLMFKVWAYDNPAIKTNSMLFEFASDFIAGRYSDPESIRRSRQKIQENHPELRGYSYSKRKNELEPEMRYNIGKE